MDRLAVIGSNSFSGAWFVRHCLEQGLAVLGASRSPEPARCFLPYQWLPAEIASGFTFVQADLNHDLARLMSALDGFRPPVIVNFAAQGMVAESWLRPLDWYRTNVLGHVALHDELRKRDWLVKYVHVGTPEVYGTTSGCIDETAPMSPSTPYAASRAACDLHLKTFKERYGFPVVWTRAANVYGAGQQLYRIVPRTILAARFHRRFPLHGGGRSVRSFIHISDVADGTLRAARDGKPGDCFHLSTDRFVSIRELVDMTCGLLGVDPSDVVEIAEDRPGKDAAYFLDSRKARRELHWTDTVSLEQGLERTIAWVDRHADELMRQTLEYVHKP
jgi:dTDP-glucose 4,6-dehydratase